MNLTNTQVTVLTNLFRAMEEKKVTSYDLYDIRDFMEDTNISDHIGKFILSDGATKTVIVLPDLGVVLKWDSSSGDEAAKEALIYDKAVEKGIEVFFPKTMIFDTFYHNTVVLQEMVSSSVSNIKYKEESIIEKKSRVVNYSIVSKIRFDIKNACSEYQREMDELWVRRALVLYGKRKLKQLCLFLKENDINDLHRNNIGYMGKNNRPVLIDFCGYWG